MKSYVISLVAAAIVCALAKGLLGERNTTGKLANLLCRILVVVTLLAPIGNISFSGVDRYFDNLSADADTYVKEGIAMAQNRSAEIIKAQTGAYILDKANRMDLEISVEVGLDENNSNIPNCVIISGSVSPYAKEALGTYIEDNLGVSKENQIWR